jgi:hypothetical protein
VVEIDPTPARAQVMAGEPELATAVKLTPEPPAVTVWAAGVIVIEGAPDGAMVIVATPEVYPSAEATSVAVVCAATLAGGV